MVTSTNSAGYKKRSTRRRGNELCGPGRKKRKEGEEGIAKPFAVDSKS
jgi:hypothetical protein